jgi:hypothetical protein
MGGANCDFWPVPHEPSDMLGVVVDTTTLSCMGEALLSHFSTMTISKIIPEHQYSMKIMELLLIENLIQVVFKVYNQG